MSRRAKAAPTLPAVNLLSDSAFLRMAARRLRHRFTAAGVVLVLLVGAAWTVQHIRVSRTRTVVAVEQAETKRLTSQTQALAPVRVFVNGVALQQRTVEDAMSGEVYFSDVLDGVSDAAPVGARLATVAVTLVAPAATPGGAAGAGSACPGPDPFNTRTVVGCVTLSGTASSRAEVGDMVVALGHSPLFVEPFISTTTTGESDQVTFSGSVGLSEKVYSKRYGDPVPVPVTAGGTS